MKLLTTLVTGSTIGLSHAFWRMQCPGRTGLA
jgi:hypothetical protein